MKVARGIATPIIPLMGGRFSPLALFAASEPGGWYDPSDLTTLFQDAAGTTPVTAVEQPVGLVLDKSRGLVLGAELVSNGTFDANVTGWSPSGDVLPTLSWSSGRLRLVHNGGSSQLSSAYQAVTTVAGRTYKVTGNGYYVSGTATICFEVRDNANFTLGTRLAAQFGTANADGTFSLCFVANGTTAYLHTRLAGTTSTGASFDIDNISVRELPGSHLSQSTSTARPVLSARVNLLTRTEDFSQAIWVKSNCTASAMNVADPVGGNTASTITATTASGFFYHNASSATTTVSNSVWVRRRTGTGAILFRTVAGGTDTDYSSSITSSWSLLTWQCTPSGSSNTFVISLATSGDAIDIWHPDCRPSNAGVGLPSYQRVGAAVTGTSGTASPPVSPVTGVPDYDTTGFPLYLKFDGTDDSLSSGSIDFTSTDKMTVCAGLRKLSDAAIGMVAELSADSVTGNPGAFYFTAPLSTGAGGNYAFYSAGSYAGVQANSATVLAPVTSVVTGLGDISGDSKIIRVNGSQSNANTGDQGTGNFGNYPLFVGSRNNASLRFNGHIYGLVIVGRALTAGEITSMETWMNSKTRAY